MNRAAQPHDTHHFKGWSLSRAEFLYRFMRRLPIWLPLPEDKTVSVVLGCLTHEDGSGFSYIADSGRYELYVRFPKDNPDVEPAGAGFVAVPKAGAHGYVRVYHDAPKPIPVGS